MHVYELSFCCACERSQAQQNESSYTRISTQSYTNLPHKCIQKQECTLATNIDVFVIKKNFAI